MFGLCAGSSDGPQADTGIGTLNVGLHQLLSCPCYHQSTASIKLQQASSCDQPQQLLPLKAGRAGLLTKCSAAMRTAIIMHVQIGNAIKFTHKGVVQVSVRPDATEKQVCPDPHGAWPLACQCSCACDVVACHVRVTKH